MRPTHSRVRGLVFIALLAIPLLAYWQRQNIYDIVRLRGYTAPAAVSRLADETTMTDSTRRLFYVYHPQIQSDKAAFNTHCRDNEQTIVLGCYINGDGIYLLDVTDDRLHGVEQVTAAHELLHAAYARLSNKERARVDNLVATAFSQVQDDRIKQTVELYRKQNPASVPNELHSILGTEVRNLPGDLEAHYAKYFKNRLAIVSYSEQYEQVFTDRRNAVLQYDAQLASLKPQIESLEKTLDTQTAQLDQQRSQLDTYKQQKDFDAYNAGVPGYNALVKSYNANIDQLKKLINSYNDIVAKRNAIASEEQSLVQALDSRLPAHR